MKLAVLIFLTVVVFSVPAKGWAVGPVLVSTGEVIKSILWNVFTDFVPRWVWNKFTVEDKPKPLDDGMLLDCERKFVIVTEFTPELFADIENMFHRVLINTAGSFGEKLTEYLHNETAQKFNTESEKISAYIEDVLLPFLLMVLCTSITFAACLFSLPMFIAILATDGVVFITYQQHGASYIFDWIVSTCNDIIYTPAVQLARDYPDYCYWIQWIIIFCLYASFCYMLFTTVKGKCFYHDNNKNNDIREIETRLSRIEDQLDKLASLIKDQLSKKEQKLKKEHID